MSDDLIAFMRARLDEADRLLRGSGDLGWLTFRQPDGSMDHTEAASFSGDVWIVAGEVREGYASAEIVSRESERLAEVEAKRRILAEAIRLAEHDGEFQFLEMLAAPYASHSDYREEWRPV